MFDRILRTLLVNCEYLAFSSCVFTDGNTSTGWLGIIENEKVKKNNNNNKLTLKFKMSPQNSPKLNRTQSQSKVLTLQPQQ